ncbi:unnamed protein product [Effrenium voratum]|nr:unnamed protein product [Effrenium voratum]
MRYSKSSLAEMTTPAALLILDSVAEVDNITLFDRDLDAEEVGGEITWDPPLDQRIVDKYRVFFQTDMAGTEKTQVDVDQPRGIEMVVFDQDTNITGMAYIGIFITAFGVEQQTPSTALIVETISSVGSVEFLDLDLDALQLGGTVAWTPPLDTTYNKDYVIYFAQSATGDARSLLGTVAVGSNSMVVPVDTYYGQYSHFVVYTRSTAYEQTTPLGLQIYDHDALVSGLSFSDIDLDANLIGGTLQWNLAADTSAVLQYNIYFTFTADTFDPAFTRELMVSGLMATTSQQHVPAGTSKLSGDGIEDILCNFTAADTAVSVFYNGTDITSYVNGTLGEWSSTKKLSFRKVPGAYLVVTAESLVTPGWCSPVENICIGGRFNQGLDYCSVAGFSITCTDGTTAASAWEAFGSDTSIDTTHQAGLGSGWSTTCQSQSGFYMVDAPKSPKIWASGGLQYASFRLLSGPLSPNRNETYTHFMIYAESTFAEQSTPANLEIIDRVAAVDYVRFMDEDLGLDLIGGEVRWTAWGDLQLASGFTIYVATDSSGTDRSLLGVAPVGTTRLVVPQGTLLTRNFTHVVVYVESTLVEQRLPSFSLLLVDEYEGTCADSICATGGGQPTKVGTCTTAVRCSNCDLAPGRIATITSAIQANMVLITTEGDTTVFPFWQYLSSCGVAVLDVIYFKAIGPTSPTASTSVSSSYTCRFSCLPGADCQTCVAAAGHGTQTAQVAATTVDADGYSVWRYLACAYHGISDAAGTDLSYSYVFSNGAYVGTAAEAMAIGCHKYIMAVASQPPFQLTNVGVNCNGLDCRLQ